MTFTAADHLATLLAALGFHRCFGYLGHHIEPLPQALWQSGHAVLIAASETGAGFMAQGWFLASGRPAVVFCSGGPGLAQLVPALQAARQEGFPLLAVLGQTGSSGLPSFQNTGSLGSRDWELLEALRIKTLHPASCHNLEHALQKAEAQLAERVPVVLCLPCDLLAAPKPDLMAAALALPGSLDERKARAIPSASASGSAARSGLMSEATPVKALGYRDVVTTLLLQLPADTLWFGDAGQCRHAMAMVFQDHGITLNHCSITAPMGWAIGAAIGAACHDPTRPVCCFTGDGSARMMASEWATAVHHHLPVTFVLSVNGVLGGPYGRLRSSGAEALSHLPSLDWCALAAAMGLPARRVESAGAIAAALGSLAPQGGPRLLVVPLPALDLEVLPPYSLNR